MRPPTALPYKPYFIELPFSLVSLDYPAEHKTVVYYQDLVVIEIHFSFSLFEPEKAYLELKIDTAAIDRALSEFATPLVMPLDGSITIPRIPIAYKTPLKEEDAKQLVRLGFNLDSMQQVEMSPVAIAAANKVEEHKTIVLLSPPHSEKVLAKAGITSPYWSGGGGGGAAAVAPASSAASRAYAALVAGGRPAATSKFTGRLENFFKPQLEAGTVGSELVGQKRKRAAAVSAAAAAAADSADDEVVIVGDDSAAASDDGSEVIVNDSAASSEFKDQPPPPAKRPR